ncbi:MAG: RagB/SusD family nutrient uptake outer membrane protein [Bacteroidota bacterium]
MKKFKLILVFACVLGISITACEDEFLEVAPTTSLSDVELSTAAGLDGSVIGAYSYLLGRGGFYTDATNWFWGSVLGGDANKGSDPGDQSQVNEIVTYNAQTNNVSVRDKYRSTYEGVARANNTLRLVAAAGEDVSDAVKTQVTAEARFLRGHYYFDLKRNFDDVPYIDETWDEITPIANDQDLWPFIIADFQFAADNLPETQTQIGRANSWAALAYLGKAQLFSGDIAGARTTLTRVINDGVTSNGTPYALEENYGDLWLAANDNGAETVFASQAAANTGSTNNANPGLVLNFPHGSAGPARPGGCCGFNQPSFELANSFRTSGGLPLLDGSYNDPANELVTDFGLTSADDFTPDAGPLDPRIDHSIGRRGIPYLDWGPHPGNDWIRQASNGGAYSPKKFVYTAAGGDFDGSSWTPGYTAINYKIIRFADVLLMAAEAEIDGGGTVAQAMEYVNMIRQRAANSPLLNDDGSEAANYEVSLYSTALSADEARQAVRFERKLELSGEGHRKYDLVRWGVAMEVLNAFLDYEREILSIQYGTATFNTKSLFLPKPQEEIDLQGPDILAQNPGY